MNQQINDKSAFTFHKLLEQKDYMNINKFLEMITFDSIIKSNHNGFISNFLYYMIETNSTDLAKIYTSLDSTTELMKRDHLNIILYYYTKDTGYAISIFRDKIILKNMILLSKDIDFILNNNMFNLLPLLDGLFITSSISTLPYTNDFSSLQMKYLSTIECDTIQQSLKLNNVKYDFNIDNIKIIIDGCNVIHSRTGKITHNSLEDLKNVIKTVKSKIGMPLLVIHKRHLKTLPKLVETLILLDVPYFLTPVGYDDDLYTIYFFLLLKSKAFIISNDKYRDHIFKYGNMNQKTQNIITQMTIGYKIGPTILIEDLPQYSKCIQHIGDSIYIPHIDGNIIKIN